MRLASLLLSSVSMLTVAVSATAQDEAEKADLRLNGVYANVMQQLDGEGEEALRNAQRAWITFRDRTCSFEASMKSGEGGGWIHDKTNPELDRRCVQRLTLERTAQLQDYARKLQKNVVATPAQSPSPVMACGLAGLPAPFTVQAVGVYQGGIDTDVHLDTDHETKVAEVIVNRPNENIVLVLMAYDPVLWKVQQTRDTNVIGVIVGGYHAQAVLGIKRSVPLLISTRTGRKDCGSGFYAYKAGQDLLEANVAVKNLIGREIDNLWSNYTGNRAHIGPPPPPNAALIASDDYKFEDYTDLPRFPSGQKGIDRLIELGLLRRATPADLDAWVEKASERYKKFNSDLKVERPFGPQGTYVVLDKMMYPTGLYGGHSVAFLIPPGIPIPDGNSGHSAVYFMEDGTCRGAVCRED